MIKNILYIFLFLLLVKCANQTPPMGGPKDEDPPMLLKSTPEHGQLNFISQRIELEFNELIKLNQPKEQLLITPSIQGEYKVEARKTKVFIELEDPLDENTTYTFTFRDAVQDLTESNPAVDLRLAFSTGDYLDSMEISGRVFEALTDKIPEDITVMLYSKGDTVDILTGKPRYITKAKESGVFKFENLPHGEFKLYAIKDKNKDYILQPRNELYGFVPGYIELDSIVEELKIPLVKWDISQPEIKNARQDGKYFKVRYSKFIRDHTITAADTTINIWSDLVEDGTAIRIYNTLPENDSIPIFINIIDTAYYAARDTIMLKFGETRRKPESFSYTIKLNEIEKKNPIIQSTITFNKPINATIADSMFFNIDTLSRIYLDPEKFTWNKSRNILHINQALPDSLFQPKVVPDSLNQKNGQKEGPPEGEIGAKDRIPDRTAAKTDEEAKAPEPPKIAPMSVYLGNAAFISIEADSSKMKNEKIKYLDVNKLAIIHVNAITNADSFSIQLLNKNWEVMAEEKNNKMPVFRRLVAGEYKMRALIDRDGDGVWSPGDLNLDQPPEPVKHYISEEKNPSIMTRANWEIGPLDFIFNVDKPGGKSEEKPNGPQP